MNKEVRQGLALLVIAAAFGLIAVATRGEDVGQVVGLGGFLFALGGLALVAVGLLRRT